MSATIANPATASVTVPAILTFGCPPDGDCNHPGLPHISDFTPGQGPTCAATHTDGTVCTMRRLHPGPHAAGNGEYIVTVWDPAPTDWDQWVDHQDEGTAHVWVISHIAGDDVNISTGGFTWRPDPGVTDAEGILVPPQDVVDAYTAEVENWADTHARVRLVRLPVPAVLAADATDEGRVALTEHINGRTDEVEVTRVAVKERVIVPGDEEPEVSATVIRQHYDGRGNVIGYAPDVHVDARPALRALPRAEVAALENGDESSDALAVEHGWLGGHDGGFDVQFSGGLYDEGRDGDVPGTDPEVTPEAVRAWLAWADRNRHLLGG